MKKIVILGVLVLLFCGCSKEKSTESYVSVDD